MKFKNLLWGMLICAVSCSIVGCGGTIEERAQAGDPEAQLLLAEIYEVGDSIHAQNADSAYFWYEKAAFQGDSTALARIVPLLYEGVKLPQDIDKCVKLAQIGDSVNEPVSQFVLALCYESGTGVKYTPEQCIAMLEKSAAQEFAPAQYRLGWHKLYEVYTKEDVKGGVELIEKAAAQDHPMAILQLGHLYDYDVKGAKPKDIDKAKKLFDKGIALTRQQADAGDHRALHLLGNIYLNGGGFTSVERENLDNYYKQEKMRPESFQYYKKAADMGYAPSMSYTAALYWDGLGTPKDYAKAMEYFEKAAAKGYAPAIGDMGSMYADGAGVPKDQAKAIELYKKGIEKGDGGSMNDLGYAYSKGLGVEKNMEKKIEWYKKSADSNNRFGCWNLHVCYSNGNGVERNPDLAEKYLKRNYYCDRYNLIYGKRDLGAWY